MTTLSGTTGRYDTEQLHYAQVIVTVGVHNGIPVRGQIIAVAIALQESGLRNLGDLGENNDHDSLGLFQQRPSQGWGIPAQLVDPEYAAGAFYRKLVTIPGWQTMPLTVAAQRVQLSAYPDAYAKWEGDATVLVGLASGQPGGGSAGRGEQCISVAGWMKPVQGPLVSGFRTTDRPEHDGVDIAAPKGTPIHAARPAWSSAWSATPACSTETRTPATWTAIRSMSVAVAGMSSCCIRTRPLPATATWSAARRSMWANRSPSARSSDRSAAAATPPDHTFTWKPIPARPRPSPTLLTPLGSSPCAASIWLPRKKGY